MFLVTQVDWNTLNPRLIASASGDKTCCVFEANSEVKVTNRLKHKDAVFGCQWSPHVDSILMTGGLSPDCIQYALLPRIKGFPPLDK